MSSSAIRSMGISWIAAVIRQGTFFWKVATYNKAMKSPVDCQCAAFQNAVDVLGRPWNAFLLTMLQERALRFSEISSRPNGPGDKVLSARLKDLEARGLIDRTVEAGP